MRQIPFHRPAIGPEEEREVLETLRSGWLTTGPKVRCLERAFGAYVGARNALAVAHCTGALHLALFALGVGPGDEVITTPFTFTATAEVISYLGARPVFVDINPATFNIDPALVEGLLRNGGHGRVRAVIPVHFAGQLCDMDQILAIGRQYRLGVVEDAAHAFGAARQIKDRGMVRAGTMGDITCFSFYVTKNITTAEGGMITTESDEVAAKIAIASLHGMSRDAWRRYDSSGSWYYEINDTGFKYNLSDVHAAIGVAQLRRADDLMRRRQAIARAYNDAFGSEQALEIPHSEAGVEHAWHLYVLRLKPEMLRIGRNQFVEFMRERGVGTSVHCIPLHMMNFYQRRYGYRRGDFPVAEDVYKRCLSLPIFPMMEPEDVSQVIDSVLALVAEYRR